MLTQFLSDSVQERKMQNINEVFVLSFYFSCEHNIEGISATYNFC